MRVFLSALFAALVLVPAASAREWNAYTPCEGFEPERRYEYSLYGYCNPQVIVARQRAFEAPSLPRVARGARAVRAMVAEGRRYTDGVSHNVAMIDLVQRGDGALLVVRTVAHDGRQRTRSAMIDAASWAQVAQQGQSLSSSPGVTPDIGDLWIHPMEVIVQTTGFGEPRTLQSDISRGGPAFATAMDLVDRAFDALPRCQRRRDQGVWGLRDCVQRRRTPED